MTTHDRLNAYIEHLQTRLRVGVIFRGTAAVAATALAVTLAVAFFANLFLFSAASLTVARFALFAAVVCAILFGIALPLSQLNKSRAATETERIFPKFEQRLVTFAERNDGPRDAMFDLLAAETAEMSSGAPVSRVVPARRMLAFAGVGAASLAGLLWLIVAAPGHLGHGAALVWTGSSHSASPLYALSISPGNASVRRNSDQMVTAEVTGLQPRNVRIYARYQSAAKWEQLAMEKADASGYEFVFEGLP